MANISFSYLFFDCL